MADLKPHVAHQGEYLESQEPDVKIPVSGTLTADTAERRRQRLGRGS